MQATKFVAIIGLVTLAWLAPSHARQPIEKTQNICAEAVRKAERKNAIPTHLLSAISLAESGRWNAEKQANIAWPWTVTSGGEGQFFKSKAEALAEVEFLRTDGVTNIDVGCMQINLFHHGHAFETVEDAFDPAANAAYGAGYLKKMHAKTNNWLVAAGAYHSTTPGLSAKYRVKVARFWNIQRGLPTPQIETASAPPSKPTSTPAAKRLAANIDYSRTFELNNTFRARRGILQAAEQKADKVSQRALLRQHQIDSWRKSETKGLGLVHLANMRRAELAQRRKKEFVGFGNKNKKARFAIRRRQQLNDWRAKRIVPFPIPAAPTTPTAQSN